MSTAVLSSSPLGSLSVSSSHSTKLDGSPSIQLITIESGHHARSQTEKRTKQDRRRESLEKTLEWLTEKHGETLSDLHVEIQRLQGVISDLTVRLVVAQSNGGSEPLALCTESDNGTQDSKIQEDSARTISNLQATIMQLTAENTKLRSKMSGTNEQATKEDERKSKEIRLLKKAIEKLQAQLKYKENGYSRSSTPPTENTPERKRRPHGKYEVGEEDNGRKVVYRIERVQDGKTERENVEQTLPSLPQIRNGSSLVASSQANAGGRPLRLQKLRERFEEFRKQRD